MTIFDQIEPEDAESERQWEIINTFQREYGFDCCGIYCQITGRRIGTSEEAVGLIDSLPGDPDEIIDDIATRIFASMRPSLHWNKMRSDSLVEMRKSRPLETLAYLLNRLLTPPSGTGSSMLAIHHDRIRLWQRIEQWGIGQHTETLTYTLLELDAKVGLSGESSPISAERFITEELDSLIEAVQAWSERRLAEHEKRIKHLEQSEKWWRSGSTLAKPAFFAAYMETKPLSESGLKKQAKVAEMDFMRGLLFEVMGGADAETQEAIKPKPVLLPSAKMPMRFGVKKAEG